MLLAKGYDVIALDSSGKMLEQVSKKASASANHVQTRQINLDSPESLPGPADLILGVGSVIIHLHDWTGFIERVAYSLSPGGILILTVDNIFGLEDVTSVPISRIFRWEPMPSIAEVAKRARGMLLNRPVTETWPLQIQNTTYELRLIHRPIRYLRACLNDNGLLIRNLVGLGIFSSLIPHFECSQSFACGRPQNRLLQTISGGLDHLDWAVKRLLYPLAAVHLVVTVKQ